MKRWLVIVLCFVLPFAALKAQPAPHPADPQIRDLVEQVNADSIFATITRLAGFHTRHTYSDTTSDSSGIGAALRWVRAKVQNYDTAGRISVEWFPWVGNFQGNPTTRHILIARASGAPDDEARYIIGGHLDSRTVDISNNTGIAPGADDNGSTSAALLELIRILPDSFAHNLEVIWFTGEEQGLWGSAAYVQHLVQQSARVDGMIAMDMISHIALSNGAIDTTSLRLYAQGDFNQGGTGSVSRNLQRYLKWVGESYADIDSFEMRPFPATDRPGRGSDHMSFSQAGYPAVRVIERNEDTNFQHNPNDTPDHLSPTYARRIAMCTFGAMLTMLSAPPRPAAPLVEQIAPDRVRVTIPDSVALPEQGHFYLTKRLWLSSFFDEIIDRGTERVTEYAVITGETYGYSYSRADSLDRPSPFSEEIVLDILPANEPHELLPAETQITASPNPFNAEVSFTLELAENSHIALDVFDLLGRHVTTLADDARSAGTYHIPWSPHDLASGIYLARLLTDDEVYITKVAYVR